MKEVTEQNVGWSRFGKSCDVYAMAGGVSLQSVYVDRFG